MRSRFTIESLSTTEISNLFAEYSGTANVVGGARLGINVNAGAGNTIGGLTAADRNVISNNAWSALVWDRVSGRRRFWATTSVLITRARWIWQYAAWHSCGCDISTVTIGGTVSGARNVISGNDTFGIEITGGSGHVIQGNYIGVDATGLVARGNTSSGIRSTASNFIIGGTATGAGNVISAIATVSSSQVSAGLTFKGTSSA